MDINAIIAQIETQQQDLILTALQTYNKEVIVTHGFYHQDLSVLCITAQMYSIQKPVISDDNSNQSLTSLIFLIFFII